MRVGRMPRLVRLLSAMLAAGVIWVVGIGGPAALHAQDSQERIQRGTALLRQRQPDAALAEFDDALEDDDNLWQAHFLRGMALGQLIRLEESLAAFIRAGELNPGLLDAYRGVQPAQVLKTARQGQWMRVGGLVLVRQRPSTASGIV